MTIPQPQFDPTPPTQPPDGSPFSSPVWQRWLAGLGVNLKGLVGWISQQLALLAPLSGASFTGDVQTSGRLLASNGAAAAPSIAFSADAGVNTGFYRVGEGIVGVSCDGVEAMEWQPGLALSLHPLKIAPVPSASWPLQVAEVIGGNLIQLTGAGPNASKSIRLIGGVLDVLNSAGTTSICSLTDGGTMTVVTLVQTSDEGLKGGWRRLKPGLIEGMAELKRSNRAGSFSWKASGVRELGVGAQSVEQFCPMAVHTDSYGLKGVKYGPLAALTAVELCDRLLKAEDRLKVLEGNLTKLQDRIGQAEWREGRR